MNATLYVCSTQMSLLQYLVKPWFLHSPQTQDLHHLHKLPTTADTSLQQGYTFNGLKRTNLKTENFQKCFCLNKRWTVTVQGLLFVCLHTYSPQTQDQHTCPSYQPLQTLLCIRAINTIDQKQSLSELTTSRRAGLCLLFVWLHVHLVLLRPVSASQRRWTRADRGGGGGGRAGGVIKTM